MNWDELSKPWTSEQCRDRYVRGSKIGLRKLAEISGQVLSNLTRWSSTQGWASERDQYQTEIGSETKRKAIDKISDRLSDELTNLSEAHYKANNTYRQLAELVGEGALKMLQQAKESGEEEFLKQVKMFLATGGGFNLWSLILQRSLQGEDIATGLKFEIDLDAAAKVLKKRGYEIVDPQQSEDNMPSLIVELTDVPITQNSDETKQSAVE